MFLDFHQERIKTAFVKTFSITLGRKWRANKNKRMRLTCTERSTFDAAKLLSINISMCTY